MDGAGQAAAGGMIYLDYQATTPIAPEVRTAMLPWLGDRFGNPHSPHRMGREAAATIEVAIDQVTRALGDAQGAGRLFFTSGATEAANWAIQGGAGLGGDGRRTIVTVATEHACVLDTVGWMETRGYRVRILPVGTDGLVDPARAAAAIDDTVALVAVMLVNNEIGTIQPVAKIGELARAAGALMLCDAVQGFGRVPLPLGSCDMVALSAHKIHGPKGIGALWLRNGVALPPLIHGGGQQHGLRSGTLSPALCVGFGAAAALADARREADSAHVMRLWDHARAAFGPEWQVNGSTAARYHGNFNIRRPGLDVGRLMSEIRDVAFSAGSACASGSGRPSHVLRAIGLDEADARASIRLGFGRYTTTDEIDRAAAAINAAALRQLEWA